MKGKNYISIDLILYYAAHLPVQSLLSSLVVLPVVCKSLYLLLLGVRSIWIPLYLLILI